MFWYEIHFCTEHTWILFPGKIHIFAKPLFKFQWLLSPSSNLKNVLNIRCPKKNSAYRRYWISQCVMIKRSISPPQKSCVSHVTCHPSHVTCHRQLVTCHISPVTYNLSLFSTAAHPQPAYFPTRQIRLVCKDPKNIYFFNLNFSPTQPSRPGWS